MATLYLDSSTVFFMAVWCSVLQIVLEFFDRLPVDGLLSLQIFTVIQYVIVMGICI